MKRTWTVRPDQGQVMSREALISALIDAATMLDIAGGCLEVVVGRAPTGVPGEMVMTGAALCWKDRTDAKPQSEVQMSVLPDALVREAEASVALDGDTQYDPDPEAEAREPNPNIDPADGFDYSRMSGEDIEEPITR